MCHHTLQAGTSQYQEELPWLPVPLWGKRRERGPQQSPPLLQIPSVFKDVDASCWSIWELERLCAT